MRFWFWNGRQAPQTYAEGERAADEQKRRQLAAQEHAPLNSRFDFMAQLGDVVTVAHPPALADQWK